MPTIDPSSLVTCVMKAVLGLDLGEDLVVLSAGDQRSG